MSHLEGLCCQHAVLWAGLLVHACCTLQGMPTVVLVQTMQNAYTLWHIGDVWHVCVTWYVHVQSVPQCLS